MWVYAKYDHKKHYILYFENTWNIKFIAVWNHDKNIMHFSI